jgi:DNA-binding transcriptional ArsR family regulator
VSAAEDPPSSRTASDSELDGAFKALADPHRRLLLDRLRDRGPLTLVGLSDGLPMTRQAVSKHLAILVTANLVAVVRQGREKWHYLNPVPIQEIHRRWIDRYSETQLAALANLREALETTTSSTKEH